ncbi:MAG: T9SS type A sorting domain-containing protein [Ignavibacteriales bacterium]|nr:T9SS type A sorting domain-containing protein [Ignavibacteriales bacterium]
MKAKLLSSLLVVFIVFLTSISYAQMPKAWYLFDDVGNLLAPVPGYGTDLFLTGTHTAIAGPSSGNGAISIGAGSYYTLTHGIDPNGGGTKVNRYTLMFDFRVAQALGMWHNLFSTDPLVTTNDGEYFIRSSTGAMGTLDIGYTTPFVVADNTWYRLILSVDNGNYFKAYIDGQLVFDHNMRPVDDPRYSLATVLHLLGDDDGDDGLIDIAEFAIWDAPLSESEVAAFGGVGTVLPVELTSFNAAAVEGNVNINWATATELNNNGFEIQRKSQQTEWSSVGFVKGNGTTTNSQEYSFVDRPGTTGKFSYRLKQIDFNGTFAYSDVVEVEIVAKEFKLYNNYPNPFNPSTIISYNLPVDAFVSLRIYNAVGELVTELVNGNQLAGQHSENFNASANGTQLPSGIYFAEIKANENIQRIKMMLVK